MPYPSFIGAQEVMALLNRCRNTAYNAMRDLNEELEKKGYVVRRGLVSTDYFCERYNLDPDKIDFDSLTRKESA